MPDMLVKLYGNRSLDTLEGLPQDSSIQVKQALSLDKEIILDFVRSNFSAAGPGWVGECEASLMRLPTTCFIAEYNKEVVGFACYEATAKGFFGPMGVAEAHRRQGIGRTLMAHVFRAMAHAGYGYAVIPWVSSTYYYRETVGAIEIPDSEPGIYARKIGTQTGRGR